MAEIVEFDQDRRVCCKDARGVEDTEHCRGDRWRGAHRWNFEGRTPERSKVFSVYPDFLPDGFRLCGLGTGLGLSLVHRVVTRAEIDAP